MMGTKTAIRWTNHTFNAWMGCTEVGPGCDNCYARVLMQDRWHRVEWGPGKPRMRTSADNWKDPLKWQRMCEADNRREMVFCNSLADVFDHEVDQQWREDLFELWRKTPNLDWQVVTKRAGNMPKMLPKDWGAGYPNVWLIATVCDEMELLRDVPKLLEVGAVVHGLSWEPALGDIPSLELFVSHQAQQSARRVRWVIGGGESDQGGVKGRPDNVDWYTRTYRTCKTYGVPYFHKQMASLVPVPRQLQIEQFPTIKGTDGRLYVR